MLVMEFIGNWYTWNHGANLESRSAVRLGRALCCDAWWTLFPSAIVRHLSHAHSDHCPLLMDLYGLRRRVLGERPFKFQAAWLRHKDFAGWLEKEWVWEENLQAALRCLSGKLLAWNKDVFGNIFRRKHGVKRRLEGVLKVIDEAPTMGLIKLERRLEREWT